MKALLDLLKLTLLLAVLAGIIYGAWYALKGHDRGKKYAHPITRPGAGW